MHSDIIVKGLRPYSTVFFPVSHLKVCYQIVDNCHSYVKGDVNPKTSISLKYLKYGLDFFSEENKSSSLVLELWNIVFNVVIKTGCSCPFLCAEYYQLFQWQVKKDDATYSETPVEISGSEDQIKKAKEMIEQIIGPDSSVTNNMGGMTSSQYH